ncbi:XRE family transcriptional regulator [Streptomyces armeniacus]|uniref:XRE family transcriptional regulator n=2 Tax=Streptomyces armeniacus TaxID=83291 RepID=A0A345Y1Q1_9ACTN|nr:XRE family transcriptional regulator [Streptomyces armeniacus]AXK37817.1 XRE family transcriptional regulator [Streptomyces armeniacus]
MEANTLLADALSQAGLTQDELAEAVNDHLRSLGREGTVSDRTVRHWLTGKTRWPHPRQRAALEAVFGCMSEELGFTPPAGSRSPTRTEDPVHRRNFLTVATGTTAAVVPLVAARPYAVGTTDVIRLRDGLDALTTLDQSRGGHEEMERTALAGAAEALELQKRAASQRVRQRLFSVAAEYTTAAAWSAVDARNGLRAQGHLHRALCLAGMGQDSIAELDVWNLYAMAARQQQDHTQAVCAAQAAQKTAVTRRDPLFASLAHARTAVSSVEDRQGALRSLGHAEEALAKASIDEPRPSWMAFYGPSELLTITSIVRDRMGDPAGAEAASHRALAAVPEQFRRNRALITLQLALTQLHQGDTDQACATAAQVFTLMDGSPLPGRMRSRLGDFYRELTTLAPGSVTAQEWKDRYRSEWSQAR